MRGAPACSTTALADAIRAPIDSKPLRELAAGARTAVIAVDDITRPTPLAAALALIVAEMAAIPSENVRILIALGAHRPMVRAELEQKLGTDVLDEFDVEQHHPYENLIHLGTSSSWNADLAESKFL